MHHFFTFSVELTIYLDFFFIMFLTFWTRLSFAVLKNVLRGNRDVDVIETQT